MSEIILDKIKSILDEYNGNSKKLQDFLLKNRTNANLIHTNIKDIYYSSYLDMDIDDFKKKNIIWMSKQFDQVIPHIWDTSTFDRIREKEDDKKLQPKIFKFKLKKVVNILNSTSDENIHIFKNINNDLR